MKAVVLLSGGVDSATCLALAADKYGAGQVLALTACYGQKHARETEAAKRIADFYGVRQIERDLSPAFALSDSSLLARSGKPVPHASYAEQLAGRGGVVDTCVPFRNGLFLAFAAATAASVGAGTVVYGAHADDAAGRAYPDCTPEFFAAMRAAVYEGSGHACTVEAPFIHKTKADIVAVGLQLRVPYRLTWSCYEGQDRPCGECGTCIDRARAFAENGVCDPAAEGNDVYGSEKN